MDDADPKVEILSQGEEIICGQTADTNAAWLSEQLVQMGFAISRHTAVGDRLQDLIRAVQEIAQRADCCIGTGGLGPTQDDLTAEAVSRAFDKTLQLDCIALQSIQRYFARLGRAMPAVNQKQALIPQGAVRLDNDWGTAPGFALEAGKCWFAFLPGVPFEMRQLFRQRVKPALARRFPVKPRRLITLRTVGMGESSLQERLQQVHFPKEVALSFRTALPENHIKLLFPANFPEKDMRAWVEKTEDAIGKAVFCIDGLDQRGGDLAFTIGRSLHGRHEKLALLETLSNGMAASQCAGASWFQEGWVIADSVRLGECFGLDQPDWQEGQALSLLAEKLAEAVRERSAADYAVAQLWSFDRHALRDESRSIRLFMGLAVPAGVFHGAGDVWGNLYRKQSLAAAMVLDLLRRYLQDCLD